MNMNKALQRHTIAKMLEAQGIASDTVDLEAVVDESLHLHENIENVERELGRSITGEDDKEEIEQEVNEYNSRLDETEIERKYMQQQWGKILPVPSVAVVVGRRRHGKSALCYWLLEFLSQEYEIPAYVLGLPKEKWHLLPTFITPIENLNDILENSICFIDEAALKFHARQFKKPENILMDQLISLSGQRRQIILFSTHHQRKLDINICADVDAVIFKFPSPLQSKLERRELRIFSLEAYEKFEKISGNKKEYAYVFTDDFVGFLKNPLPSFWSEELSEAYKGLAIGYENEAATIEAIEEREYRSKMAYQKIVHGNEWKEKLSTYQCCFCDRNATGIVGGNSVCEEHKRKNYILA